MTITQLSNLFNTLAQNVTGINYYHCGWPNDMNLNIQNNSDPTASTGAKFPYLLLIPPTLETKVPDSSTNSLYKTYSIELLLTDTYGFEQQQLGYKSDTMVDILGKLETLADVLLNYLRQYAFLARFNIGNYTADLDPYRFAANTRSIRLRFQLMFPIVCPEEDLDISFLPEDFNDLSDSDLEKPEIPN